MTVQKNTACPSKMPSAIFLDSGGVINDNAQRAPQWIRYLGEFLPTTVLGGTAEVWGMANVQVIRPFFRRWGDFMIQAHVEAGLAQANAIQAGKDADQVRSGCDKETNVYTVFERIHLLVWIEEMVQLAAPHVPGLMLVWENLSVDDAFQIARSAHLYAIQRVKADYPGAVDTIRSLSMGPYKLYTSSADSSEDLEIVLKGLGVFECFDAVYGSDRVNCLKMSPLYYTRVFDQVGVHVVERDAEGNAERMDSGDEVVVLDDNVKALSWARSLGARTVLITGEELDLSLRQYRGVVDYQLRSLAELPALLESWRAQLEGARS
ncbi:hypothetical protein BC939DRAFT_451775 [Gamsiella multidivaricata]|uniref:uncharacterized protein n=1 Tax=Gamsiella multidivaricata TaxID=101098 RepID=UPI00222050FE|nr:uncharacterized protein BC939DRAFT_451775 [Gamsiella multidivaricata]KAG0366057.1 hypothetical protein BGZ54_005866 [Gamsiella multidivaricata]KAI7823351.1 hypothetical protein BC939DRAFT_451775 [Gamsiella multidivaricata]